MLRNLYQLWWRMEKQTWRFLLGNPRAHYMTYLFLMMMSSIISRGGSDTVLVSPPSIKHWRPISTIENSSLYLPNFSDSFSFLACLPGAHRAYGWLRLIRRHYYYYYYYYYDEDVSGSRSLIHTRIPKSCQVSMRIHI